MECPRNHSYFLGIYTSLQAIVSKKTQVASEIFYGLPRENVA